MGAFDTVKLLLLSNPHAPYPPDYLVYRNEIASPVDPHFISIKWKSYMFATLQNQAFHDVLSSTAICGQPGRRPGIPTFEPSIWIQPTGQVQVGTEIMSENVYPCQN